jgi:hypothetical protein
MFQRLAFFSLIFVSFSQFSFSNTKLFPGYYLLKNGDTVQCQLEFGDWNMNPQSIQVQVGTETRNFKPEEIGGFGVTGYSDYISATVTYHTSPVSGNYIPELLSDSTETGSCFLKVLDNGPYPLYDLLTQSRVYFFTRSDKV